MSLPKTNIALVGNPNSGKSSLFNHFTGLRQRIGNFPGVTVDKKLGTAKIANDIIQMIDLPGTYSLYPNSKDEKIVIDILTNPDDQNYPDCIIYVADVNNLERHLLLATQIMDLQIPMILCLNMMDLSDLNGEELTKKLKSRFDIPVICVSSKTKENLEVIENQISIFINEGSDKFVRKEVFYQLNSLEKQLVEDRSDNNEYLSLLKTHHVDWLSHLTKVERKLISEKSISLGFEKIKFQIRETLQRFNLFSDITKIDSGSNKNLKLSEKIDSFITHRLFGPIIFFAIMFIMFQSIYAWSEWPMNLIDNAFASLGQLVQDNMSDHWFRSLLVDGVIAGLGGIVIFIPQITILFLLIAFLEEIGYMSRAVFMFDGIMRRFGLNGRSIVALVSSGACAIPAIMSTRTISNWKERLTTIMVAPLISCSARIPVYAVLVGFVVPSTTILGIFNAQGLVFMGLYILGIVAALVSAWVFKIVLKSDEPSFLMIELPQYKTPIWKNIFYTVKEKVTTFIVEAGKVIFVISIVLWFLASYGPNDKMALAEQNALTEASNQSLNESDTENLVASYKLESSYAGHLGKLIEPTIAPLGFDWKMGIALISSFAAREVFVGTMATIYSIGNTDDELTVREKMAGEINPITKRPVYNMATSLSLLIFYVFALQCMSTLAVTKRETKSWKWPLIQFSYMGILAYLGSLIVYQLLS